MQILKGCAVNGTEPKPHLVILRRLGAKLRLQQLSTMSFGYSIGDFITITHLAYTVVQNSRKACGVHSELAREATSLHIVLQRLQREVEKPNSLISRTDDGRLEELQTIIKGCDRILKVIDQVLNKYNGMSEEKRRVTRFRLKVQFGNGEMKDIGKIRQELATYTSAITLFLNLLSLGSQGKVEEHMERNGKELGELRQSLNWITAMLQASSGNREGSILTSYGEDDKAIWKEFRRELLKEGFSSDELRMYKGLIKEYVMELGARGVLDVQDVEEHVAGLKDMAKETMDAGQGKEVSREVVPVLESIPPRTRSPDSSPDEVVSTLPLDNHINVFGRLVEDTTQALGSSTPLGTLSDSANQIPIDAQQVEDYPISQENNTPDQPVLQIEYSSDFNTTSSEAEEETIFELTKTAPDIPGTPTCGISVQYSQNESTWQPAIRKKRITPKPVSIEEVEDEDFGPGAHPNCDTVGMMADEYGDFDGYSDQDTTGSLGYIDDLSDDDDFSSSELSPEDWRTIPAPLWREERSRNSPQIFGITDFGADGSGKKGGHIHREPFGRNVTDTNSGLRPKSPSGLAKSLGAHTRGVYTLRPQPHEHPASPHTSDAEQRAIRDIVKQFGFDPFRKVVCGTTTSSYGSSSINESGPDISRLSPMSPGRTMGLTAAALQQVPEDPRYFAQKSRATLSTIETRSKSIAQNAKKTIKTRDIVGMDNGDNMPSIRFLACSDPQASRPSLYFSPVSRTLSNGNEIIEVGRRSKWDSHPNNPTAVRIFFESKVVSRRHCEFWCYQDKWYIKDVKSSSGTFLNNIRLSSPKQESPPYLINDGDIVQLGIGCKVGGLHFLCVMMRLELNRE
jgi:hypothetical protein